MAKRRRRKPGSLTNFVAITWEMLNSHAYKDLTPNAGKILPYFLGKPKINPSYPSYYEAVFEFTYSEAEKYGFCSSTFSRCIQELIEKGFVDPFWKGGLRGDSKSSNRFKLSKRWEQYGKEGFIHKNWKGFITANAF